MNFLKWLYPGMHVKRWLALLGIGVVFTSLGVAYLLVEVYREQPFPDFAYYLTLQFIDRAVRGLMFIGTGLCVTALALVRFNRGILSVLIPRGREGTIVDTVYQRRNLRRGPNIVAIGGGTGLSTLLRGLKDCTHNLTAIVTVADDGGSSGRLRRQLGILPPGDFRQCIIALAESEPLMAELFQYRFAEGSGLDGHSFGNLFIAAMSAVTGNFDRAIRESSRVLAVTGQVLPSTVDDVTLCAQCDDRVVEGESAIPKARRPIKRVFLHPAHAVAHPEAVRAILQADLIVLGPGSLFTSLMPNLLVPGITEAIRASRALRVYVCNVATQDGETDGFTVNDHIRVLTSHLGPNVFDCVLANDELVLPPDWSGRVHLVDLGSDSSQGGFEVLTASLIDLERPYRHHSQKLAEALMHVYYDIRSRPQQTPLTHSTHYQWSGRTVPLDVGATQPSPKALSGKPILPAHHCYLQQCESEE